MLAMPFCMFTNTGFSVSASSARAARWNQLANESPAKAPVQAARPSDSGNLLSRGSRGEEVAQLQRTINASGANPPLEVDGKFGPLTDAAVRDFQTRSKIQVDGIVGPETRAALGYQMSPGSRPELAQTAPRVGESGPGGSIPVRSLSQPNFDAAKAGAGFSPRAGAGNATATFDDVRGAGQRNQMVTGKITVNGNSYDFRSGGHGRGSLPAGQYEVSPHMWSRDTKGMTVGGVGYSFAMSDKYDSRVGGTRSLLRIHPDGGSAGTQGCIGIVGDAATQRRFREDMRQELARNGRSFTLNVG
ncbi:MAG: peptidoglycan-binding protein [Deltaproteobacteria bacterium]|nr:peptidoglycan-binding protein [Deltaproteobacteria bacterium]